MKKTKFAAHGNMDLSVENALLVVKASGSANVELIKQYRVDVANIRQQMPETHWISLVILSDTPMITPDGKNLLLDTIEHARNHGLCAMAVVFDGPDVSDMLRQFWCQVYGGSRVSHKFFAQEDQARLWLNEQLENKLKQ